MRFFKLPVDSITEEGEKQRKNHGIQKRLKHIHILITREDCKKTLKRDAFKRSQRGKKMSLKQSRLNQCFLITEIQ